MADFDVTAIITVLASTGVLTALITGVRGLARSWSGREEREQLSIRRLKLERDREWERRVQIGEAFARLRILAVHAGVDEAELANIDALIDWDDRKE